MNWKWILVLVLLTNVSLAQKITLEKLRQCKEVVLEEYVFEKESKIKYPITGLVYITIPSSLKGESIVEVELWVIDADGKVVYNTVYGTTGKNMGVLSFDPGYMEYMNFQGRAILRTKRERPY